MIEIKRVNMIAENDDVIDRSLEQCTIEMFDNLTPLNSLISYGHMIQMYNWNKIFQATKES